MDTAMVGLMDYPEARALALSLGLNPVAWGLATLDSGIEYVARTRRECLIKSGICTRYTRRPAGKWGSLYLYESQDGTVAYVGYVVSLLMEGFPPQLEVDYARD